MRSPAGVPRGRAITQAEPPRDRYREAGVDIDAGDALVARIAPAARSTRRAGAAAELGGFGALFDLAAAGFKDPLLVTTTDGVGTKLLLATEHDRLAGIGIDLVAMCVNDLVVQGATPLLFLDYLATGKLDVARAASVIEGIAAGCREAGCALVGGETAEMPGLYRPGHLDLAGFALGAVERRAVLPRAGIAPGDVLLGLASSGVHSNGFSLVRLLLAQSGAELAAPAPFASPGSLLETLLTPTRIYVTAILAALAEDAGRDGIKALAHITGGGLPGNLPRVLPKNLVAEIDAAAWPVPPVFGWLSAIGGLSTGELARTFNMGIGLVLVVAPSAVDGVTAVLTGSGETVHRIGELTPGAGPARVELRGAEAAWRAA